MENETGLLDISKALIDAQAEVQNPEFSKTNLHLKYKYAELKSVIKAVKPVLAKHGLSIIQSPVWHVETSSWVLISRITHTSGQWQEFMMPMFYVCERGNASQSFGSALTYARRYAYNSLMGIVGDEDDDGEASHDDRVPYNAYTKPKPKPKEDIPADNKAALPNAEAMHPDPVPDDHIDILVNDFNALKKSGDNDTRCVQSLNDLRNQATAIKPRLNAEQFKRLGDASKSALARLGL